MRQRGNIRRISKSHVTISEIIYSINDLNKRLSDKQITISLTENAKSYVSDKGYDANFGARPLKRFIQKTIENLVAKEIIKGNINDDSKVTLDAGNDGLYITK